MPKNAWLCSNPLCGTWTFADKVQCHGCWAPRPFPYVNGNGGKGKGQGKGNELVKTKAQLQLEQQAADEKQQRLKKAKAARATKKKLAKDGADPKNPKNAALEKELAAVKTELTNLKKTNAAAEAHKTPTVAEERIKVLNIEAPVTPTVEDDFIFKKIGMTPLREAQLMTTWVPFPAMLVHSKTPEEEVEAI